MATVYLWKMSSGQQKRVGHLALLLNDNEKTYISFWPACSSKSALWGTTAKFHTYDEDVEAEGGSPDDSYWIPPELLDLEAIGKWWARNNRKYKLFRNNCALTVYMALKEGGIKLFRPNMTMNAISFQEKVNFSGIPRLTPFPLFSHLTAAGGERERNPLPLPLLLATPEGRKELEDDLKFDENGAFESLPVAPATAFSWIKDHVEEQKKGMEKKYCLVM